jgi:hypothetical protein
LWPRTSLLAPGWLSRGARRSLGCHLSQPINRIYIVKNQCKRPMKHVVSTSVIETVGITMDNI